MSLGNSLPHPPTPKRHGLYHSPVFHTSLTNTQLFPECFERDLWRIMWSILSSAVLWELENRCGISGPNWAQDPRGRRWKQLCWILKGQTVSQVDTVLIWNSNVKKDAAQYSYTGASCHCTRGEDSLSQLCHCAKVRNRARVCVHTEEPWRWFLWNSLEQFPAWCSF